MRAFALALIILALCAAMYAGDVGWIPADKAQGWNVYGSIGLIYAGAWFWRKS